MLYTHDSLEEWNHELELDSNDLKRADDAFCIPAGPYHAEMKTVEINNYCSWFIWLLWVIKQKMDSNSKIFWEEMELDGI